MKLHKIYNAFLTSDLAAAEAWYSNLFGRKPDNRLMPSLVQWEFSSACGFALSTDKEIAGNGVMFFYVDDLDEERRRLAALGIELGADIPGDYSTLAQVSDADGNRLTLATRPSRPFPTA